MRAAALRIALWSDQEGSDDLVGKRLIVVGYPQLGIRMREGYFADRALHMLVKDLGVNAGLLQRVAQ